MVLNNLFISSRYITGTECSSIEESKYGTYLGVKLKTVSESNESGFKSDHCAAFP